MPKIVREEKPRLERDIQAEIRLRLGAEEDLVLWRNAQVYAEIVDQSGTRPVRGGLGTGSSDLVGVLSARVHLETKPVTFGRFFVLEVKKPGKKPTDEQRRFLALVRRMGGFAGVVTSADEAHAALVRARKGESA
jgi:hypothetical protein